LILPYDKTVLQILAKNDVQVAGKSPDALFWAVIILGLAGLIWAVWQSKRETGASQPIETTAANTRPALSKE
jgi:hypothetical protein